jgi:hypothetical protein
MQGIPDATASAKGGTSRKYFVILVAPARPVRCWSRAVLGTGELLERTGDHDAAAATRPPKTTANTTGSIMRTEMDTQPRA